LAEDLQKLWKFMVFLSWRRSTGGGGDAWPWGRRSRITCAIHPLASAKNIVTGIERK
jgi:hypothetical protein